MGKDEKPPASIETQIHLVRGMSAMLDSDLASLYGVSTKALLQAIRRNRIMSSRPPSACRANVITSRDPPRTTRVCQTNLFARRNGIRGKPNWVELAFAHGAPPDSPRIHHLHGAT